MDTSLHFTDEDTALMADDQFFRKKEQIMIKVRRQLEDTQKLLQEDLKGASLVTPPGFVPTKTQLVKGEHLESFPFQYLDCPKHFEGTDKFTFRTLFWWGHHLACALLLEGTKIKQYKKHIVDRFHRLAGQELELSLAPSLWEWKRGEGYTLPMTHDRKARIAAVLAERSFLKVVRFVPLSNVRIQSGQLPNLSRETFRAVLPIITL
ncbi:MAG TPA: hypothetical protein VEI50_14245 [Nitrospiraceae bacterium]|jgi:hypothetical protein|nr:hypothetical protein [Nitrospiraceae bacterium]